jgi:glycosyltransferase involved in cell wall biosynthesis
VTPPRTSVILPAWNAEATLREAVESALAQTVADFEMVVVDDGSRLPATECLAGLDDRRVRVIRLPRNRGVARARNAALKIARAPLVSQLDADDAWEPDYLERILPSFERPEVGLAYANAVVLGNPDFATYVDDPAAQPVDTFPALARRNPIPATTVTMRTAAVRAAGGYSTWFYAGTDYHLYLKLAAAGWRFAYVDRLLARYRAPELTGGITSNRRRAARSELAMWAAFAARHPRLPLDRGRLLRRAVRRYARQVPAAQRAVRTVRGDG